MGTPRRYLPNLTYGSTQNLKSANQMHFVGKAAEAVAEFVSRKIPNTNSKVHLFFRYRVDKPNRERGVRILGVDEENNLSIRVTVLEGSLKFTYVALLKAEEIEATELKRLLENNHTVMAHALDSTITNTPKEEEETASPEVVKPEQSEAVIDHRLPIEGFMKDETNVSLLLDKLYDLGAGITGLDSTQFGTIVKKALEDLIRDPFDHLFVMRCIRDLQLRNCIKHPHQKPRSWMFDAKAYELIGKPVPRRLTHSNDHEDEEDPSSGKNKIPVKSPPVVTTHLSHSNGNGDSSVNSLAKYITLKAKLLEERERLTFLQKEVSASSAKVRSLEEEMGALHIDKESLKRVLQNLTL